MSVFSHKKTQHPLHSYPDLHKKILVSAVYVIWIVLFLSLIEIIRRIISGF